MENCLVPTDLGIELDKDFDLEPEDIVAVKNAARRYFD